MMNNTLVILVLSPLSLFLTGLSELCFRTLVFFEFAITMDLILETEVKV